MALLAERLLVDIDKDTVDFQPNYDESLTEPVVLPTRVPNLLVNGTSGIAVGMATNIPPHNLGEVVNALLLVLDDPEVTLAEIMTELPGPDFPTAGFIHGRAGIHQAYTTGRGIIQMRAKAVFEPIGNDRTAIIVEELPYQVNKARLVERIALLVHEKKIEGISDLRDESSREGMRIAIELKRGAVREIVLNHLYKLTPMQSSFGVILLALVDGQPKVMPLKELLVLFLAHRRVVVRRRTAFELDKAERRAHVLEGLRKALDHLDAIIELIRASDSPTSAREGLMQTFEFSQIQAQAILEMRLQRLTALERGKVNDEYESLMAEVARLKEILVDKVVLKQVIREELIEVRNDFQNERRTSILDHQAALTIEDLIPDEPVVITATRAGYIKRTALDVYRSQARGGKGRRGMSTRTAEDLIEYLFVASTHSYLLVFTTRGRMYWVKVYELPEVGAAARGRPIINLINVEKDEQIADILSVNDFDPSRFVVSVSKKGIIKKTSLEAFSHPRTNGIIACKVEEGDELLKVNLSNGQSEILLCTVSGKAIRFSEKNVRPTGRVTRGVKGIALRRDDAVVSMCIAEDTSGEILSATENGYGKRTALSEYRLQRRGGLGVINISTSSRNGLVVGVCHVREPGDMILITAGGKIIRLLTEHVRKTASRNAQGVKLIDLGRNDRVADITLIPIEDEDELDEGSE
jgi:DNA gyrase subunit A